MNDQNDKAPNSQESQDPSSETTAQNASESSADTSKNDIDSKQGSQNSSSESSDQQRIKVGINSSGPWVDISLTKKGIQVLLMVLGIISIIVVMIGIIISRGYGINTVRLFLDPMLEPVIKIAIAETKAAGQATQLAESAFASNMTPSSTPILTNTHALTLTPTPFADLAILEVTWSNNCEGSVTYIPEGFDMWLVVEQNNTYHPQTGGPVTIDPTTGEFKGICLIGAGVDQNIGEEFTVYAVLVDSDGSQIFTDYLANAEQKGYPGFKEDDLPDNKKIGSMKITRKGG